MQLVTEAHSCLVVVHGHALPPRHVSRVVRRAELRYGLLYTGRAAASGVLVGGVLRHWHTAAVLGGVRGLGQVGGQDVSVALGPAKVVQDDDARGLCVCVCVCVCGTVMPALTVLIYGG